MNEIEFQNSNNMFNALSQYSQGLEETMQVQQDQTQDEIIRITIDLGNNLPAESIIVLRGQENKCDEIARQFCIKHGFDMKIQEALTQQIQRNIDHVMEQGANSVEQDPLSDGENIQDRQITNQNRYNDEFYEENQYQNHEAEVEAHHEQLLDTEQTRRIASREASTFKQRQFMENPGQDFKQNGAQIIENLNQTSSSQGHIEEGAVEQMYPSAVPHHDDYHHDLNQIRDNQRKLHQEFSQQIRGELGSKNTSAAVRPVSEHRFNQPRKSHHQEPQSAEMIFYDDMNSQKFAGQQKGFNGSQMQFDGQTDFMNQNAYKRIKAGVSHNMLPQRDSVNFQLLHPECRDKPQINQVSRLLAQGKRSNEPIHERLFKQDILAKRIALENQNEPNVERSRSRDNPKQSTNSKRARASSAHGLGKPQTPGSRNFFKSSKDPSQAISSIHLDKSMRNGQRFGNQANDESFAQIQNPGARLYQKGIQMNHEKERFIEQARKEREENELINHCTFKPKLVTQDYYQIKDFNSSSKYQSEMMLDEFNDNSARNPQVPSITVEKLIIKDLESINTQNQSKPISPILAQPLLDSNVNDCSLVYTLDCNQTQEDQKQPVQHNQSQSNQYPSQVSKSQVYGYQSTSDRLMKFGQNIQSKRQVQKDALQAKEESQYDFQPRINNRSRSIASQKSVGSKKVGYQTASKQVKLENNGQRSFIGEQKSNFLMTSSHVNENLVNKSQIVYNNQDSGILDQSNFVQSNLNNQTQMPGGDDDDEVEEIPEDITDSGDEGLVSKVMDVSIEKRSIGAAQTKQQALAKPIQMPLNDNNKFLALYDDAKHRNLRQEHIYAKCFDKECTFKPKLITKESKVSQKTVQEVQMQVYNKSQQIEQKPAVGGVPSKNVTHSRLAYLSNREGAKSSAAMDSSIANSQINNYKTNIRSLQSIKSEEGQVFERLSKQAQIYQNLKREKKELQDSCMINPDSGKEMFKPSINSSKLVRDKSTSQNQVISNMYNRHKLILEKKKRAVNAEEEKCNVMRRRGSKANKFSEQIVIQARKNKINQIFDHMDSDGDGLISSIKMNSQFMDQRLLEIFKPLFTELEQLQEPLDREEFIDATTRLYSCLPQNEKNLILSFGKKKTGDDYQLAKCTFKPKTNDYKLSLIRRSVSQARPKSAAGTNSKTPVLTSNLGIGGSIMDKILKQQESQNVLNNDLRNISSPSKSKAAVCAPQVTQTVITAPNNAKSAPKVAITAPKVAITTPKIDILKQEKEVLKPTTVALKKVTSSSKNSRSVSEERHKPVQRPKTYSQDNKFVKIDSLVDSKMAKNESVGKNETLVENETMIKNENELVVQTETVVEEKNLTVDTKKEKIDEKNISPLIQSSYLKNQKIQESEKIVQSKDNLVISQQKSSDIMTNVLSNFMEKKISKVVKPERFAQIDTINDTINNENIPPKENIQYQSIHQQSKGPILNSISPAKRSIGSVSPQKQYLKGSPSHKASISPSRSIGNKLNLNNQTMKSPQKVLHDQSYGVTIEQETPIGRTSQQIKEHNKQAVSGFNGTKQRKTKAERKNGTKKSSEVGSKIPVLPDHFASIMTQSTQIAGNQAEGITQQDKIMVTIDNGHNQSIVSKKPVQIPKLNI